jgi:hypothetical protein
MAARYHTDVRHVLIVSTLLLTLLSSRAPGAQRATGTVTTKNLGTITVSNGVAYLTRDQRDARVTHVEILLTDVALDTATVQTAFDPHMTAINLDVLDERNYVLLWVNADGSVGMNATYSKTMTQFTDDTRGGLSVMWTTRSASRLTGRLTSKGALRTVDGSTYVVDLTFDVEVPPLPTGPRLPAGGGEPGESLRALLAAAEQKDWAGIRAGSSPEALKTFDRSYNTPAENAAGAAELLKAWMPTDKLDVTGGVAESDTIVVLDVEGELFPGQRTLTRVRMVKNAARWQFDRAARAGFVP